MPSVKCFLQKVIGRQSPRSPSNTPLVLTALERLEAITYQHISSAYFCYLMVWEEYLFLKLKYDHLYISMLNSFESPQLILA